jgi:hypothetical protein
LTDRLPHFRACRLSRVRGALVVALALGPAACDSTHEDAAAVTTLTPSRAYSYAPIEATLRGTNFRPSLTVDTNAGTSQLDLRSFQCSLLFPTPSGDQRTPLIVRGVDDPTQLHLQLPAGLAEGHYDVELRDPHGNPSRLKNAFQSLGPDLVAPDVKLDWPLGGTYLVGGTHPQVTVSADDHDGHLRSLLWSLVSPGAPEQLHHCPSPMGASRVVCSDGELNLPEAPVEPTMMVLAMEATDEAGIVGRFEEPLWLARAPVLTSFAPNSGPSTGMTQIVVRGQSFSRATRVLIDGVPLTPNGGMVDMASGTIVGFTPAHDPGSWPLVVETGNVQVTGMMFTYMAVPVIRRINPDEGSTTGGFLVTVVGSHFLCNREQPEKGTQFFIGAGLLRARLVITDCQGPNRVVGMMPPYTIPVDGTGAVSLFAVDATAGESELPNAFTYIAVPDPAF